MDSQNPYVQHLSGLDRTSSQFPDRLNALLDVEGYLDYISNSSGQDARWLVEYLDDVRTPIPMRISLSKVGVGSRHSLSYQPRLQEMPV